MIGRTENSDSDKLWVSMEIELRSLKTIGIPMLWKYDDWKSYVQGACMTRAHVCHWAQSMTVWQCEASNNMGFTANMYKDLMAGIPDRTVYMEGAHDDDIRCNIKDIVWTCEKKQNNGQGILCPALTGSQSDDPKRPIDMQLTIMMLTILINSGLRLYHVTYEFLERSIVSENYIISLKL